MPDFDEIWCLDALRVKQMSLCSKPEPEVEMIRQWPPFWILFSDNISAVDQNISTKFGT